MIWLLGIIILAIILLFLILRGVKGRAYSLETLQWPIEELLSRGFNGGFLIIDISDSRKFIQLRKYINKSNHGIELAFPQAKWSIQYFEKLKTLCKDNKIPYSIKKEIDKHTLSFLYIDFSDDVEKAYEIVKKVLILVFGVKEETKLFLRLENASIE